MSSNPDRSIRASMIHVYLTNIFHVAVRLFSNRSQMTSKCGKNKKVAHEAIAECATDVRQHGIYLLYNKETPKNVYGVMYTSALQ